MASRNGNSGSKKAFNPYNYLSIKSDINVICLTLGSNSNPGGEIGESGDCTFTLVVRSTTKPRRR